MQTKGKPNLATRSDGSQALTRDEQLAVDKKVLFNFLRKNEKTMIQAWKGSIDPRDLNMIIMGAVAENPRLLQCSARSIIRAMVTAARCKIKPGGHMGRGYLVPRRNKNTGQMECCFDPGYRGMSDLARRTGEVTKITSHVVKKDDKFKYDAAEEKLEHEPNPSKQESEVICAYAIAKLKDGDKQIEVVWKNDLDKIRSASMAKSEGTPWGQWYDEMARKSSVRRLCKWLPVDDALEVGMAASDNADGFGVEVFHTAEQEEELAQITEAPLGNVARPLPPHTETAKVRQAVEPDPPRETRVTDTRGSVTRVERSQEPPPPKPEPKPEPPKPAPEPPPPAPKQNRRKAQPTQEPPVRRRRGSTTTNGKPNRVAAPEPAPEPPVDDSTPFDGDFDEGEPADVREPGADENEGKLL